MKKLTLLLSSLAFAACTQVRIINPNPHVEVPEIRGDRGLTIGAQYAGGHMYQATDDGSARPPNLDAPQTFNTIDPSARVTYSPSEPFELGLELHPVETAGGALVMKYMLSGEGTRAAAEGDFATAVYARIGASHSHANGDQKSTFGPGGYPWQSSMDAAYATAGLSMGIRTGAHALIYWGAAYGHYLNRTEITQDANTSSSPSPGGVFKSNDYGDAVTVGPGVLFNWKYVQFYLTGEATHIQYHNAVAENDITGTAGIMITPR